MYPPRSICSRCSSRMRLAASPSYRRTSIAWFSSPAADSTIDSARPPQQAHRGSRGRLPPAHKSTNSSPFSRRSRSDPGQLSAVALFNDVLQRSGTTTRDSPSSSADRFKYSETTSSTRHSQSPLASALGEWEIAARLKEISEEPMELQKKLQLFEMDILPYIKKLRGPMPKHLYMATTRFLTEMVGGVVEQGLVHASLALSKIWATIGRWDLDMRNELILNLCHVLISRKNSSSERYAIMGELLDMWKHLSQLKRGSQLRFQSDPRFVLPSVDEIKDDILTASSPSKPTDKLSTLPTTRALASIFTQFSLEQAGKIIPGLLATLAVLSDARLARLGLQIQAAPLLNLVSFALEHQPADGSYVGDVFASSTRFPSAKLAELQTYVLAQWPQAEELIFKEDSAWRQKLSSSSQHKPQSHASGSRSGLASFHKQLRAAYLFRNTGAIVSIWQDLKDCLARSENLALQLRRDPEFLDFWIFVWCAVRRPNKLQETFELMQQVQVQPTVRTYTSMMHGWKTCKDAEGIEALWQKLVESGLKMDSVIWTERISGLIECGNPQAGIHALAEMQGLWKKALASKGDPESAASVAIQPTIEVVNAAFKGLLAIDRRAANEVLAWAGREGIEPNIRTFNILLRESFRTSASNSESGFSSVQDVTSLLKAMKAQGVEPDAATFTIILEELLGGMGNASAAEQIHVVEQILADIRAAGLKANLETYGKMLYAVSSLANGGADETIAAVQQHMRADGLTPTPHMVTILIERALSRDPLPANTGSTIRAILQEHKLHNINQGDQTLWERVMSAYAVTGDLPSAKSIFDQLAQAGRPVTSLPCLTDLLNAILAEADAKSIMDAKEVVRVTLNHKLGLAAEEGDVLKRDSRYWRHHFWFLARENGLINWEDVPPELEGKLKA